MVNPCLCGKISSIVSFVLLFYLILGESDNKLETYPDHPEHNEKNNIKRFEEFLKSGNFPFFDVDYFEFIIDHYLENNKFKKALKACDVAIDQHPFSGDFHMEKAQVLIQLEEHEKALNAILRAETFLPSDPETLFIKATIFICLERYDEGVPLLQSVIDYVEDKSLAWMQLGMAHMAQNNDNKAVNCFKEALSINLKNEDALYELSECLDILGKLDEALPYFESAIDENPYSANAWFNLGVIYDKLQQSDDALKAYDYAVTIDEEYSSAYFNMGVTHYNQEDYGDALKLFKKTLELETENEDDPLLFLYLGQSYHMLGDIEKAIKNYQKAGQLNELLDAAWFGIGEIMTKQERWLESLHYYKKAHDLNPYKAQYLASLAKSEYNLGNHTSSADYFEKAIQLNPENKDLWLDWSFIFYENNNVEKAIQTILLGIEELPKDVSLLYRLTAYQIKARNYKDAFKYLENALILGYEKHTELLEFFSDLETQKGLMKVIDQIKNKDVR